MDEFLSDEEVQRITCYSKPKKQREALIELGFAFIVNRLGRPLVRRDELDKFAPSGKKRPKVHRVNFEAMKRGSNG